MKKGCLNLNYAPKVILVKCPRTLVYVKMEHMHSIQSLVLTVQRATSVLKAVKKFVQMV